MKTRARTLAVRSGALFPLEALTLIPLLGVLIGRLAHRDDVEDEAGLTTAELLVLIGAIVLVVVAVVAIIAIKLKNKSNSIDLGN